jgi:hypothetical protein
VLFFSNNLQEINISPGTRRIIVSFSVALQAFLGGMLKKMQQCCKKTTIKGGFLLFFSKWVHSVQKKGATEVTPFTGLV